jgi:hypothetical protein
MGLCPSLPPHPHSAPRSDRPRVSARLSPAAAPTRALPSPLSTVFSAEHLSAWSTKAPSDARRNHEVPGQDLRTPT